MGWPCLGIRGDTREKAGVSGLALMLAVRSPDGLADVGVHAVRPVRTARRPSRRALGVYPQCPGTTCEREGSGVSSDVGRLLFRSLSRLGPHPLDWASAGAGQWRGRIVDSPPQVLLDVGRAARIAHDLGVGVPEVVSDTKTPDVATSHHKVSVCRPYGLWQQSCRRSCSLSGLTHGPKCSYVCSHSEAGEVGCISS